MFHDCLFYSDTDVDAMDDFNVREYLESRIDSDPDDDELPMPLPCTVPPEPLIDTKEETDDQHIQVLSLFWSV